MEDGGKMRPKINLDIRHGNHYRQQLNACANQRRGQPRKRKLGQCRHKGPAQMKAYLHPKPIEKNPNKKLIKTPMRIKPIVAPKTRRDEQAEYECPQCETVYPTIRPCTNYWCTTS